LATCGDIIIDSKNFLEVILMLKRLSLIALFLLTFLLANTTLAQGPTPQHTDAAWQASYWNNTALSGTAVLQRSEPNLDHNWGAGSPGPGVNSDQFSARWTRYIDVPAGNYRFTATADDGIRVWVNGDLLINDWSDHQARTVNADRYLGAGHHLITVEYYENSGQAVAAIAWTLLAPAINNWRGEYFNNNSLSGSPALVRDDAQISFNWGSGSPAPGVINTDNFSARWTRTINIPAGNHRFTVTADDGVRLWVNGHLLIDVWMIQAARTFSGDIYLPGGNVEVKMEYFEQTGQATAQMSWTAVSGGTPPPSTGVITVDNGSEGFVKGGAASSWRTANNIGQGGSMLWTYNNDQQRNNYNWARWYPNLTAGRYEVFVFIPRNYASTRQANYWVSHRDGFARQIINQNSYSDHWVSLGTYHFQGNSSDYVSLSDITGETYLSRMIGFDAVKWERR
jgi:hypothetical protein